MKTFEELKEQITPEFIKKLCELAEGFAYAGLKDFTYSGHMYSLGSGAFPLLLRRAVEGWNNKEIDYNQISIRNRRIVYWSKKYEYLNYQPSHLTPCEMAILDCLIEVLI